jgi:hypothetical protein
VKDSIVISAVYSNNLLLPIEALQYLNGARIVSENYVDGKYQYSDTEYELGFKFISSGDITPSKKSKQECLQGNLKYYEERLEATKKELEALG